MGDWHEFVDGESVSVEQQNQWVQEVEYDTVAQRDAASSGWGTAEFGRQCQVIETGFKYYWTGINWQRFPATGGAGAPVDAGYVVTALNDQLTNETLHNTLTGAQLHDPKTHTHTESDITDLDHDAQKIKAVTVDDSAKGDGKVLMYKSGSGYIEYSSLPGGGDMTKAVYDQNSDDTVDNSEKLQGYNVNQVRTHYPLAHRTSHESGGSDEFVDGETLDAMARVEVQKGGVAARTNGRRKINFVNTASVTWNVSDNPSNERTDVQATATQQGSYKLEPDYTVYVAGSTWYAMDEDGNVDYSNTEPRVVINQALSAVGGGSYKRKVLIKGNV